MRAVGALAILALAGCSDGPVQDEPFRSIERACDVPEGATGRPETFEELAAHINLLPRPVDLPCLLSSFERPLAVFATSNDFSAQPAYGPANPRTFLFFGDLAIAFVPKGPARNLIELSLFHTPTRSLKGEFEIPIEEPTFPESEPYDHVLPEDPTIEGTSCSFCHFNEERDMTIAHRGYVSDVILPDPFHEVPLEDLWWQFEECQPDLEPDRCAIFDALLAHGEVTSYDF